MKIDKNALAMLPGLVLNQEAVGMIVRHAELVREWNKFVSLVSRRDADRLLERHIVDSLSLVPVVDHLGSDRGVLLDIGSGGGYPAIPLKIARPEMEIVVITGYSTVSSAVDAMKLGAYDYLPKPFTEDEFRSTLEGALKQKEEVSVRELLDFFNTEEGKLIQKGEVIRVLERTAHDYTFWRDLLVKGSITLDGYRLSLEAKAALVSGDLKWIKQHVGDLTYNQLRFIHKRLEREAW